MFHPSYPRSLSAAKWKRTCRFHLPGRWERNGTDSLSRNVGKGITTTCWVITHKNAVLHLNTIWWSLQTESIHPLEFRTSEKCFLILVVWLFVASGRVSVVIDCTVEYFANFPTDGREVHNAQLNYASNARCRLFKFPDITRQAIKSDKYTYFLIDPHARLHP